MSLQLRSKFEALGTRWQIYTSAENSADDVLAVLQKIQSRLTSFEQECSRFLPSSVVSEINQGKRVSLHTVSAEFRAILKLGLQLQTLTHNSFSLGAGRRMVDSGYDAQYSFQPRNHSAKTPFISVEHDVVRLHNNAVLDFGSLGKGMAIDLVSAILQTAKIQEWLINAGGDIRLQTRAPQQIVLQHPNSQTTAIGSSSLHTGACAASSSLHRQWENGHHSHLVNNTNPQSKSPIIGTFTQAQTALVADALSTAFFVAPSQFHSVLADNFAVTFALVFADGSMFRSPGFQFHSAE